MITLQRVRVLRSTFHVDNSSSTKCFVLHAPVLMVDVKCRCPESSSDFMFHGLDSHSVHGLLISSVHGRDAKVWVHPYLTVWTRHVIAVAGLLLLFWHFVSFHLLLQHEHTNVRADKLSHFMCSSEVNMNRVSAEALQRIVCHCLLVV
jgi:hypothetical protein